jgi:hypothetical protein
MHNNAYLFAHAIQAEFKTNDAERVLVFVCCLFSMNLVSEEPLGVAVDPFYEKLLCFFDLSKEERAETLEVVQTLFPKGTSCDAIEPMVRVSFGEDIQFVVRRGEDKHIFIYSWDGRHGFDKEDSPSLLEKWYAHASPREKQVFAMDSLCRNIYKVDSDSLRLLVVFGWECFGRSPSFSVIFDQAMSTLRAFYPDQTPKHVYVVSKSVKHYALK